MKYSLNELLSNDVVSNDYIGNLISEEGNWDKLKGLGKKFGKIVDTRGVSSAMSKKLYGVHGARIEGLWKKFPNFPNDKLDGNFIDAADEIKDIYNAIVNDEKLSGDQKNFLIDDLREKVVEKIGSFTEDFLGQKTELKLERTERYTQRGQEQLKQEEGESTRLGALEKLLNSLNDISGSPSTGNKKEDSDKEGKDDKDKKGKPEGDEEPGLGDIQELVEEISVLLQEDDFNEAVSVKVAKRIIKRVVRRMNRGKFNDSILRKSIGPMLKRAEIDDNVSKEILDAISEHFELSVSEKEETKEEEKRPKKLIDDGNVSEVIKKTVETSGVSEEIVKNIIDALRSADAITESKNQYSLVSMLLEADGEQFIDLFDGEIKSYPLFPELLKKFNSVGEENLIKILKSIKDQGKLAAKPKNISAEETSDKKPTKAKKLIEPTGIDDFITGISKTVKSGAGIIKPIIDDLVKAGAIAELKNHHSLISMLLEADDAGEIDLYDGSVTDYPLYKILTDKFEGQEKLIISILNTIKAKGKLTAKPDTNKIKAESTKNNENLFEKFSQLINSGKKTDDIAAFYDQNKLDFSKFEESKEGKALITKIYSDEELFSRYRLLINKYSIDRGARADAVQKLLFSSSDRGTLSQLIAILKKYKLKLDSLLEPKDKVFFIPEKEMSKLNKKNIKEILLPEKDIIENLENVKNKLKINAQDKLTETELNSIINELQGQNFPDSSMLIVELINDAGGLVKQDGDFKTNDVKNYPLLTVLKNALQKNIEKKQDIDEKINTTLIFLSGKKHLKTPASNEIKNQAAILSKYKNIKENLDKKSSVLFERLQRIAGVL